MNDMFYTIILAWLSLQCCESVSTSRFHKETLCDVQARIGNGCTKEVPGVSQSILKCLSHCDRRDSCVGASIDTDTNKCYIHDTCDLNTPCQVVETKHKYYSSYCVRGKWVGGTCECFDGCYGDRCEHVIQNCPGLRTLGFGGGHYKTFIDPSQDGNVLRVFCLMSTGTWWAVGLMSNFGKFDFNKTWDEYVDGVFIDFDNYMVGLKAWHIMTSVHHCTNLVIALNFIGDVNVYGDYWDVVVSDETNDYSLTLGASSSHGSPPNPSDYFGNCLDPVENVAFSTWDKTNGNGNCASIVGTGWWHPPACNNPCNLLGRGLDDWDNTPVQQKLNVVGVDMDTGVSLSRIVNLFAYVKCY